MCPCMSGRVGSVRGTRLAEGAAVGLLIVVALVARVVIGMHIKAPAVFIDELLHAELARNLLDGKWFEMRGAHVFVSFTYPLLTAPAWLLGSTSQAYGVAKATGAVAMVSVAVPIYLWSRRLMPTRFRLTAVALSLLPPAFVLASSLMLETLFLPAFVLALFCMALMLEHPSLANQAYVVLAIVFASATRFQGLILVPVVVTAIGVYWLCSKCLLRRFTPILLTIGVAASGYLAWRLGNQRTVIPAAGVYEGHLQASYTVGSFLSWFHANAAALVFATVLVPAYALVVLSAGVLRRKEQDRAVNAYVAVTLAALLWLLILASLAAKWEPLGLKERYTFYIEPVLLMALPLWLSRKGAQGGLLNSVAALAVTALVVTLPLALILSSPAALQSYSFLGISSLADRLGSPSSALTAASIAGALLAASVIVVPRRYLAWSLPAVVAGVLLLNSWFAIAPAIDRASGTDALSGIQRDREFVDNAVPGGASVYYLNTTTYQVESSRGRYWETWVPVWEAEFWNRRIRGTLNFGLAEAAPVNQGSASLDWSSGHVNVASPAWRPGFFALTDPRFRVAGTDLGQEGPLVLTRPELPLRLRSAAEGVDPSGYMFAYSAFDGYAAGTGRVTMTLASRYPLNVRIVSGTLAAPGNAPSLGEARFEKRVRISPDHPTSVSIRVPEPPYRVEVHEASAAPIAVSFDPR